MSGASTSTGASRRGRLGWSAAVSVLGVLGLALVWGGCNTQRHYELLSFFFDGVPDPNRPLDLLSEASASPTFSQHQPFVSDDCLKCHEDPSQMTMSLEDSSLCLQCHEDVTSQYPRMHGAVVGLACLRCHSPHFSSLASLLREPAPGLCMQCHDTNQMGSPSPQHEDLTRDCLECHTGHGGPDPHFLRASWADLSPAPPPSSPPPPAPSRSDPDDAP
ncbi:MAG: putative CXXCH cytochrome family protein [Phycisphaerales bacterium]|jgi:predicted CXXCH cytochrome family protein